MVDDQHIYRTAVSKDGPGGSADNGELLVSSLPGDRIGSTYHSTVVLKAAVYPVRSTNGRSKKLES
jgi:hypothetical protein